jgi:putative endonuclease
MTQSNKQWFLYVVQCADDTLYCGVTTDVVRRVKEHNFSVLGAKYTRSRRPVVLLFVQEHGSRSLAQTAEFRFKKLSRFDKLKLIEEASAIFHRDN